MDQQPENKVEAKITQEQNVPVSVETNKEEAPKSSTEWDKFRQARAQERKQAEEISRQAEKSAAEAAALKAALDSVLNKPTNSSISQQYDQNEETEDQRIEKRVNEALAKREAEHEKKRMQREQEEFPQRLTSTFNDFNQVCNTENLDYLEYHYPEVASAFRHVPEGFDKWAAVYKAVKRFVPNTDTKNDQAKAEKNFNKPQSISSPAVSQGGVQGAVPTRLEDDRKAANWARMQKALKGLG